MLKKSWNKCIKYKFTLAVVALILIAILMPGDSVPEVGIPGIDKVIHFGMFFTLAVVFYLEYFKNNKKLPIWYYAFAVIFIFASSTEVMQIFAIDRSMDLLDLSADIIGIFIGIILTTIYVRGLSKAINKINNKMNDKIINKISNKINDKTGNKGKTDK